MFFFLREVLKEFLFSAFSIAWITVEEEIADLAFFVKDFFGEDSFCEVLVESKRAQEQTRQKQNKTLTCFLKLFFILK